MVHSILEGRSHQRDVSAQCNRTERCRCKKRQALNRTSHGPDACPSTHVFAITAVVAHPEYRQDKQMPHFRFLVAITSLILLLGACSKDSTAPVTAAVDENQPVAGQQSEAAVDQTWEPVRRSDEAMRPEEFLPIHNMPVPDDVLIAEMEAADAAAAAQQANRPAGLRQARAMRPTNANQAQTPQHPSSANDVQTETDGKSSPRPR